MPIRAIAFDLDDTLMDTSGILVPKAAQNAFQILIDAGLRMTLQECEVQRKRLIRNISHKDVFSLLAKDFGSEKTVSAVEQANLAFYHPQLPMHLPLLEGALENLILFEKKYALYLVTAGFESAQIEKIKLLGIFSYFKKIFVVDSLNKKRKLEPFKKIIDQEKILPHQLLCIGNSLSSEIKDAKNIGAKACFFEFGDDRGIFPIESSEKPDYHVKNHRQIQSTCGL